MKPLVFFGLLSLMAFAGAAAQESPPEPKTGPNQPNRSARLEQAQKRLAEIKDRLKLTPDQVEQVRPIFTEEMRQLKAVRDGLQSGNQRPRDRMQAGRKVKSIESATDEKLKPILSKEQMAQLKKLREERREQLRSRADAH